VLAEKRVHRALVVELPHFDAAFESEESVHHDEPDRQHYHAE
jgi:hypothetical protein